MKKKIFSILLVLALVCTAFVPATVLPEAEVTAEAATAPTCTYAPVEISTYTELSDALRQAYNGMVLQLTADITLTSPTYDITIEPDMYNYDVVLDLNGYDITITGANSSNGLFYLCCPNSSFHIMNSAYKFNDISGTTSVIKTDLSAEGIVNLNNSTASCYIYPGISLQGSTSDALVKLYKFEEFIMYGSDITVTDASSYADCIAFYNGSLDGSNVIALNKANLTAKKGDCIDLRGAGTFTANSYDTFVLNHTMLNVNDDDAYAINLSGEQNENSTVNIGKLSMDPDRVNVEVDNPYYGLSYHSGLIQDIFNGCSVYFFNSKLMNTETMCSHSSRENVFTCSVKNGHIFMCSTCKCDYYISPHASKTYLAPTATAEGNTAGADCSACGYVNYYKLPAESMVDPFTKVQEVASWASLANAVAVSHPTTIRLKNDIVVEDHNNSYTLTPQTRGNLVIDLNGHSLIVNSDKTKYLFNLSNATIGSLGTNLSIVSTTDAGGGSVIFNTTQKNAAVVRLAHKANSFNAMRVGVILGSDTDSSLNTTEAYAQTYAIDVSAAHKLNIYTASVYNYKENGTAIRFVVNAADTFKDTTVRIYRSAFKFNTFGLDFDNSVAMTATDFGDCTISNNNTFTPLNSTASVLDINGSSNTITLADIVDTDFHFVDGTYSVSPDKVIAYSNFETGKEYYTKWRWNSSNQCAHEEFVNVLSVVFGHYRYCTRCKKGSAEDHTIVLDTDKSTDADHANDGIRYYYCANENCGYTESIVDPAIGHYPETDDEGEDIIIRKKAATCCESGVAADYYVCGYCREYILLETGEITTENDVIIPKTDEHDFKEYKKCDPTCISDGWTLDFEQCKDCGTIHNNNTGSLQIFTGSDATAFINAVRIPKVASNHKMTKYVKKDATCTEDGVKETFEICEYCNEVHKESGTLTGDAAMEFFFDSSIPKLSHNLTAVDANPATCTTDGNIAHYKCTREDCGKYFADDAATTEITDITVAATGHDYEWVVTAEPQVGVEGEKINKCNTCGNVKETQKIPALEPEYILGDVDGDGSITSSDARLALRAAVGLETLDATAALAADVDGTAGITSADARLILRAAVGLESL